MLEQIRREAHAHTEEHTHTSTYPKEEKENTLLTAISFHVGLTSR